MVLTDLGYYIFLCIIWVGIFVIFWGICGYFLYHLVDRKLRACPSCKRKASGKIESTDLEPLGTQIDRSGKEPMQVISEKVTDHFECEHCHHTWVRTFERKERIPVRENNIYKT